MAIAFPPNDAAAATGVIERKKEGKSRVTFLALLVKPSTERDSWIAVPQISSVG
jgi:hypothetical protein